LAATLAVNTDSANLAANYGITPVETRNHWYAGNRIFETGEKTA